MSLFYASPAVIYSKNMSLFLAPVGVFFLFVTRARGELSSFTDFQLAPSVSTIYQVWKVMWLVYRHGSEIIIGMVLLRK